MKHLKRNYQSHALFIVLLLALPLSLHVSADEQRHNNDSSAMKSVEDSLQKMLEDPKLKGSIIGISVRDANTGQTVLSVNEQLRLRPASNMKLLTGAAALEVLGEHYQFTTVLFTDGTIQGNTLIGNLYLQGRGDPTLQQEDLLVFAKHLKQLGIKKITGDLIVDDYWYDEVRYSQDLNWNDEDHYVGAAISALTISPNTDYDAGTLLIEVLPSSTVGSPPIIKIHPTNDYVHIINQSKTTVRGEKKQLSIHRQHGTNQIIVKGHIPLDHVPSRSWIAVWEPSELVINMFYEALQQTSITLKGTLQKGKVPPHASSLTSRSSDTLQTLFNPLMKLSNNTMSEILIKEMGRVKKGEGSWEAGLEVLKETLDSFGFNTETSVFRDGSGMSHKNLITPEQLSSLLYQVQEKEWFSTFLNSLPVAGHPDRLVGGTLRNRLTEIPATTPIHAKTGSITGVSTLSGYMTTKEGTNYVFVIMLNNFHEGSVTSIEDKIVRMLYQTNGEMLKKRQ